MKRKLLLRSIGSLALILCAVLVFGTASSKAYQIPLTDVSLWWDTTGTYHGDFDGFGNITVYTQYYFKAKDLPNFGWNAFCVQSVPVPAEAPKEPPYTLPDGIYTLKPLTAKYETAAKMADHFFNVGGYTQRDYQIAIWHQLGVVLGDIPTTETGAIAIANAIAKGYDPTGKYALAHGGFFNDKEQWVEVQDFMVKVPEPGTILLLGAGLIGLVGFRRFRKR